jgi:hypothetical protein
MRPNEPGAEVQKRTQHAWDVLCPAVDPDVVDGAPPDGWEGMADDQVV